MERGRRLKKYKRTKVAVRSENRIREVNRQFEDEMIIRDKFQEGEIFEETGIKKTIMG